MIFSKALFATLLVWLGCLSRSFAAYCNGSPDAGDRTNDYPIYNGDLRFVKSVKNGVLYEAGPASNSFYVVHVYGSPYEMGFAQGQVRKRS